MTTILADFRLGMLVSDSNATDDDRIWSEKKTFRHKGSIFGFSGDVTERMAFMEWVRGNATKPKFSSSYCLELCSDGLFLYMNDTIRQPVPKGIEAIGTGAKAAMCAYEALGFQDPKRAVKLVCKHDAGSRVPVRVYRLKA